MENLKTYRSYIVKKIFLILILFILVFIGIELFSRFIAANSLVSFGNYIVTDQKVLIANSINKGIVGIGDSIMARSFYPELFSDILTNKLSVSYPTYNLGVPGASLAEQMASFRRLIKKKVKPSIVILSVPVHILNVDNYNPLAVVPAKIPIEFWDNNAEDYYTRCDVQEHRAVSNQIYCFLSRNSYFLKMVGYYHQQVTALGKPLFHTAKMRTINLIENPAITNKGFSPVFQIIKKDPVDKKNLLKSFIKLYKKDYKVFKLGSDKLDPIIDELNQHSIKTIIVLMPLYQSIMRQVHNQYSIPSNEEIITTLANFAQRKNVGFVNLFEELQSEENFEDPVHLNVIGAAKVTKILAKKILTQDYIYPKGYLDLELYQNVKIHNENTL